MPEDMSVRASGRGTRRTRKPAPALARRSEEEAARARAGLVHIYHNHAVCETETRGFATPQGRSPLEIFVDASDGFIPLWEAETVLRWRFNEPSLQAFADPEAAKEYIRGMFGQALELWGAAVPVKFKEVRDAWDFEITVAGQSNCSPNGCTLARAFFPDGGQHDIMLYPTMFEQSEQEQKETLAHELGHVFGLRHFFAEISETDFPVRLFGKKNPESIMNYGEQSRMTDDDRADLKALYALARAGTLTEINGTPVRLVRPFSALRVPAVAAAVQVPPALAIRQGVAALALG